MSYTIVYENVYLLGYNPNMLKIFLILIFNTILTFGNTTTNSYQTFANLLHPEATSDLFIYNSIASIPPELHIPLKEFQNKTTFNINFRTVNPFYLSGDFDGDNETDFAILIKYKSPMNITHIDGEPRKVYDDILIFRSNGSIHSLNKDLPNGVFPKPIWRVIESPSKSELIQHREDLNQNKLAPKLTNSIIKVNQPESSSAIIYWDRKKFNIYWTSD